MQEYAIRSGYQETFAMAVEKIQRKCALVRGRLLLQTFSLEPPVKDAVKGKGKVVKLRAYTGTARVEGQHPGYQRYLP